MATYKYTSRLVGVAFVAFILAIVWTVGEAWPNLSCHPTYNDSERDSSILFNKGVEERCLRGEQTGNGICAKHCHLRGQRWMLHENPKKLFEGPITFEIDSVIDGFSRLLGYYDGLGGDKARELKAKVRKAMEECAKKHKEEYSGLQLNGTNCDPSCHCDPSFKPFLACMDKAYGC